LGVLDVNDFSGTTALSVDNVQVTAIPEPSTVACLLLGLGGFLNRLRQRKANA
jgi:hypothetical protein